MGIVDAILYRLGLVRLKRFGLDITLDGRLVTAMDGADRCSDTWERFVTLPPSAAVDLLRLDEAPRRLARGSVPPPIPAAMAPTVPAPRAAPPAEAALRSGPPPRVATAPPATRVDEADDVEWERAMERAHLATEIEAAQAPTATEVEDEEWEWKLAMARASSAPIDDVERPRRAAEGTGPTPLARGSARAPALAPRRPKAASRQLEASPTAATSPAKLRSPLPSVVRRS